MCTLLCHAILPLEKREDSNHCLQISSQITHLHGAVKSESYTTNGSGSVFSNKFINNA